MNSSTKIDHVLTLLKKALEATSEPAHAQNVGTLDSIMESGNQYAYNSGRLKAAIKSAIIILES